MRLTLVVHRQDGPGEPARTEEHELDGLSPQMSVLDALDLLNTRLLESGGEPVAFESDCREGICGACGITVDGRPHGPQANTPVCHQRLASFTDGQRVVLEPLRGAAYPVLRDLVVDRSALDRVITAGGHVATDVGTAPDADTQPVGPVEAERALDFAACIGCGACVAACPNGSAHLFTGSKLAHLSLLPTPARQRAHRARAMVTVTEAEFGGCTLYGECAQVCPAEIPLEAVAAVNRELLRGLWRGRDRDG